MRSYVILTTALFLLVAQAAIVGIALFGPRVPDGYRAFFIDQTDQDFHP